MKPEDIEFPVRLTMKIIAENAPRMDEQLNHCLQELGIVNEVVAGNHSRSGTYLTYHAEATFADLDSFRMACRAVAKVEGVKMVL